MSSASASFSPDALIAHRNFIQTIANALLRDMHGAEDVAQEVLTASWQKAADGRAFDRGWFATLARNFARNRIRTSSRSTIRERAVAASEIAAPASALERVETGHRVVSAVLSLEQPYQQVILLRYFEDLTPAQIAQRLETHPSTVRAQLARAHEKLREKLEPEFASQRAFVLALARWAKPATAKLAPGLLAGAAIGLVVTGTTVALLFDAPIRLAAPVAGPVLAFQPLEPLPSPPVVSTFAAIVPVVREGVPQPPPEKVAEIRSLENEAKMIQAELRKRLLTPPPQFAAQAAALGDKGGVTRILGRDRFEFELREPLGIRGGGAHFSFITRSHSYDDEPDLAFNGFQHDSFSSGFYGGSLGLFLPLGDCALEALSAHPDQPPATLDARASENWKALLSLPNRQAIDAFQSRSEQSGRLTSRVKPVMGSTTLLRSMPAGGHDVVVAFRILDQDAFGYTIAWRTLAEFPIEDGREKHTPLSLPEIEISPQVAALTPDQLIDRLKELRTRGSSLLLLVRDDDAQIARNTAGDPSALVSRILPRGGYDAIVAQRLGGAFVSFTTGSNDYNEQPTIQLAQGTFTAGFYGGTMGVVVDLGAVNLGVAEATARRHPQASTLLAFDGKAIDPAAQCDALRKHMDEHGWEGWFYPVPVEIGHSYLVRKACDRQPRPKNLPAGLEWHGAKGEPSVTAIFQPTARDEFGALTIVWKVLETN